MNTLVIEGEENEEVSVDVYQKLAADRILFLSEFVDSQIASDMVATLMLKDMEDAEKKITMFINAEGGDIRAIFMIYDAMKMISAPVETVCVGVALEQVALILAAGKSGMRVATKNSIIGISQLSHDWSRHSDMTEAKQALEQGVADNKKFLAALGEETGKTPKQLSEDFARRSFVNPGQAVKYGIIDKVVGK
jgi:ATP-dependent Clp protease protease subunit